MNAALRASANTVVLQTDIRIYEAEKIVRIVKRWLELEDKKCLQQIAISVASSAEKNTIRHNRIIITTDDNICIK